MKTIGDYREEMLTLLGDAGGRRYTDAILDKGLQLALMTYRQYCPRKELIRQRVLRVEGDSLVLPAVPDEDLILTIRTESREWLEYSVYRSGLYLYVNCYGTTRKPAAGSLLELEMSVPHTVKGLNRAEVTTVPDGHSLTVAGGASGYAMQIRARSVTEVFGKRPEDREALMSQAEQLIENYYEELNRLTLSAGFREDPWPKRGWV